MNGPIFVGRLRRRSNKRQQAMLANALWSNMEMAKGADIQDPRTTAFWTKLALELNKHGCRRSVAEWQHIWVQWVLKIRKKVRKIKNVRETGSRSSVQPLTKLEQKVLEATGTDRLKGFSELQTPLVLYEEGDVEVLEELEVSSPLDFEVTEYVVEDPTPTEPKVTKPLPSPPPMKPGPKISDSRTLKPQHLLNRPQATTPPQIRLQNTKRRRSSDASDEDPNTVLVDTLNDNNKMLKDTIISAANILAAAIRDAGNAIARQIVPAAECISTAIGGLAKMEEEKEENARRHVKDSDDDDSE